MPQSAADFMAFARQTIVALRRIQQILGLSTGLQKDVETLLAREHNDLDGLQGGTTGEYYHLTATEADHVADLGAWSYAATESAARTALGFSSKQWTFTVPFQANGAASLGMGAHASGAAFLAGNNRNATKVDLSNASHARLIVRVTTLSASTNTPRLRLRGKKTTFSTTITDYADIAASGEIACGLEATGVIDSGWIALDSNYQADNVILIVDQIGGNGVASPACGPILAMFKGTNTEP